MSMGGEMNTTKPSFRTPAEVVTFIKQCIEMEDAGSLYGACAEETNDFWKPRIFQDLCDIRQAETLEAVFLKDGQIHSFPSNATIFSLGGCNTRTRHLNVDLEKLEGCWRITKIWKCR
jgi:hypothetical protein